MGQCLLPSWQTIFMILLILLISFFFFCIVFYANVFVLCYTNQIQYFLHLIYYHIRLVVVENRSDYSDNRSGDISQMLTAVPKSKCP